MNSARVIVVGGGFAGLSAAVRIGKIGHHVTLVEKAHQLGGRLRPVVIDGHAFDITSPYVTLPGVFRDLFRKSGRTIDREIDFHQIPGRRHYFSDSSPLDLPMGNRGDQVNALATWGLDSDEFSVWLDSFADIWDIIFRVGMQRHLTSRSDFTAQQWRLLHPRRSLSRAINTRIADNRIRRIITDRFLLEGHDPRRVPSLMGVTDYLERNFGLWTFDGGMDALANVLTKRLGERKVDVRLGTTAIDYDSDGVITDAGRINADVIIWAARLPHPGKPRPIIPASRTLLVLNDTTDLPPEAMIHGESAMRMYGSGSTVTIEHRVGGDPLEVLARAGLELRDRIAQRYELSAVDLAALGHWGYQWRGWRTVFAKPGIGPSKSLFIAGAHGHVGPSIEAIGIATTTIAETLRQ